MMKANPITRIEALRCLDSELHPYLIESPSGVVGLASPFINTPILTDVQCRGLGGCRSLNESNRLMREIAEEKKRSRDYSGYIGTHSRLYRLQAFNGITYDLSDREYWTLLREIWTDAETIWRENAAWLEVLRGREHPEWFMTAEDRKVLSKLPETFTIYRGYVRGQNPDGFSWTLNREIAKSLANNGKGATLFDLDLPTRGERAVRQKKVVKSKVFAFTDARSEREIILLWDAARRKYVGE